jgi:hypothetical protein
MRKVTKKNYKKKLDTIFSQFIRLRDRGKGCYTCGVQRTWKELQCGHFIPRQYLALRYDERNCHAQCYACNMLYNGQPSKYALRLMDEYGERIIAELESLRRKITKDFPYELKIEEYTEKIANLLNEGSSPSEGVSVSFS